MLQIGAQKQILLQLDPVDFGVHDMEEVQLSPDRRRHAVALRNKHNKLLLLLAAARRNSGCSLIGDRRVDLLCHAGSDRVGSNRLS
jgi:hypothetical protein